MGHATATRVSGLMERFLLLDAGERGSRRSWGHALGAAVVQRVYHGDGVAVKDSVVLVEAKDWATVQEDARTSTSDSS